VSYLRAFSTLGCPELSLEEVLRLAEHHQIAGIELRVLEGNLDLPTYFSRHFQTPAQAAQCVHTRRTQILALDTSFQLSDADDGARVDLLKFVPWAEAMKAPRLRVFDGGKTASGEELECAAATVRWWRALRRKNSWTTDLMIETHDSLFTTKAIRQFLALVPDAGILWDAHHTWKHGGEDPVATWRAIKDNVVHVHVKDSVSRPSARHPYTYVLPGGGEFPAAGLIEILKTDSYAGPVSLEWERLWHSYLPSLDSALVTANRAHWW
jgi:sugar phosphate isomerase/epimerase